MYYCGRSPISLLLLIGVVLTRRSKNISSPYEKFLKALTEANIPESVIKNKTALNQYRKLKHDNKEVFNSEVSSTAARQDNDMKSKYVQGTGMHLFD